MGLRHNREPIKINHPSVVRVINLRALFLLNFDALVCRVKFYRNIPSYILYEMVICGHQLWLLPSAVGRECTATCLQHSMASLIHQSVSILDGNEYSESKKIV